MTNIVPKVNPGLIHQVQAPTIFRLRGLLEAIERGIVRQRVGSAKTAESEQKVSADPAMLQVTNYAL